MARNVNVSTSIAIVSFSYDQCSFKLTTMMIINIYGTKYLIFCKLFQLRILTLLMEMKHHCGW